MSLSIIVPCYNESERLPDTFPAFANYFNSFVGQAEILFVDDGSTDGTINLLEKLTRKTPTAAHVKVKLIRSEPNRGKGYAIRHGFFAASNDYVLLCDADLSCPLQELDKLWICREQAEMVLGSRKHKDCQIIKAQPLFRVLLGVCYSWLSRIVLGVPIGDFTCGFKLLQREALFPVFEKMTVNDWAYDSEMLCAAHRRGLKILEVGVRWQDDPRSRVRLMRDIAISLKSLLQIRLRSLRGAYD